MSKKRKHNSNEITEEEFKAVFLPHDVDTKRAIARFLQWMGLLLFGSMVLALYVPGINPGDIDVSGDVGMLFECFRALKTFRNMRIVRVRTHVNSRYTTRVDTFKIIDENGNLITMVDYVGCLSRMNVPYIWEFTLTLSYNILSLLPRAPRNCNILDLIETVRQGYITPLHTPINGLNDLQKAIRGATKIVQKYVIGKNLSLSHQMTLGRYMFRTTVRESAGIFLANGLLPEVLALIIQGYLDECCDRCHMILNPTPAFPIIWVFPDRGNPSGKLTFCGECAEKRDDEIFINVDVAKVANETKNP